MKGKVNMEKTREKGTVGYWLAVNYPTILACFEIEAEKRHEVPIMLFWSAAGRRGSKMRFYINNNKKRDTVEQYDYCIKEIA